MAEEVKKLNVLIVEDDDMTRKLLVIEFKRRGHNVLEYSDAAAAMGSIGKERNPLDAAIVDLMNMGYGGNIGDYLRNFVEYKNIVVLYYTALTKQQFDNKILQRENTYFIHKQPGSLKQVADKIESVCR